VTVTDNPTLIDGMYPVGIALTKRDPPYVDSHTEICVHCGEELWVSKTQTIPVIAYICETCMFDLVRL
jgi:hypothetical protein